MRIKTSGTSHVLYRYAGTADGKSVESKIGVVPVGTSPGALSADLLDDLTPKEARELREYLEREQVEIARVKLAALPSHITEAVGLVNADTLDDKVAESLALAATSLLSAVRRVVRARKAASKPAAQSSEKLPSEAD